MNCRHVRALLSAYLDSELTGYEMLAMRDHLANCSGCADERHSLELVRAMVRALPQRAPREQWVSELRQEVTYSSLPFAARLRTLIDREFPDTTLFARRVSSAAMLAVIGVFLAAAASDSTTARYPDEMAVPNINVAANRPMRVLYGPDRMYSQASFDPDLQFLDPRMHPADLTGNQTLLASFNTLRPQSGYNNVNLISLTSSGNQLVSSR
ncbi:MAG: anti-sigma factor [Capsulimonadaceae bacterium]|nr:anti-sigma factor [Capsulimonadaceae bacterium]